MNRPTPTHLSEEAILDLLIGLGTAADEAHLAECPLCRGQIEPFHATVASFNRAGEAWSEARRLSHPLRQSLSRARHALPLWAPAAAALAALLLLAINLAPWHRPNAGSQSSAYAVSQSEDSAAQIAADNDLMRSVHTELNPDESSSLAAYRLVNGPSAPPQQRSEGREQ